MGEPIIRVHGLHKHFGANHVLRGIDLTIERGEVLVIIGPSGSGKSTLLRCLNFLEEYEAGEVWFGDDLVGYRKRPDGKLARDRERHVAELRAQMGMVFQSFNLFPYKTVLENVIEGPVIVQREPVAAARARGLELLRKVGLADKADAYPSRISGGQQQRAAIARALVTNPAILLADEPTGNLDTASSVEIMRLLTNLNQEQGRTVVLITHEADIARFAKRVVELRDGRILRDEMSAA